MADIVLKRSHTFPVDIAKAKLAKLVDSFRTKNPSMVDAVHWTADGTGATATGKMFECQFKVTDADLSVEVELKGFAAKLAKGMAQSRIEKTVGEEFPA